MKKCKYILFFIFAILISNSMNFHTPNTNKPKPVSSDLLIQNELIAGIMSIPRYIDPHFLWGSVGLDVTLQVFEGLYANNLSDPDHSLIPLLASDYGTWHGRYFEVPLRSGVTFHDGTPFNASAVKWSFDRLLYWTNSTGLLPYGETETFITALYLHPDGTPIIKAVHVNNTYLVTFELTRSYGAFESLLTFSGSFIMSPSTTPYDKEIESAYATSVEHHNPNRGYYALSGTGPFLFEGYMYGIEVKFQRNDNYWRESAKIETLTFAIILDSDERNNALVNGDIHFLRSPDPDYYEEMRAAEHLTFVEAGGETITQYLGMNNVLINKTWRHAISYAIDYDYMIDNLLEGEAIRLKSPLPPGILYANDSLDYATLNVTKARQILVDAGVCNYDVNDDFEWLAAAFISPLKTLNYTYNLGNQFRADVMTLLEDNLAMIGISLIDNGLEWDPYLDYIYGQPGYNQLSLCFLGWMPDYNDPSNYVNSLMSNVSSSNTAQINDPYLESLMKAGLETTDSVVRRQIYNELQRYCVEDLMPWAWCYNGKNYDCWVGELRGFPSNGLYLSYFYPCEFGNYSIQISHPSDVSYSEGDTGNTITWLITAEEMLNQRYYVYRDDVSIQNDTWDSGIPVVIDVDNLSPGAYLYRFEVHNAGDIIEDYVIVHVEPYDYSIDISHPSDVSYLEGDTGNNITWVMTAANVLNPMYYVYRNVTSIREDPWDSAVPIVINVDGLSPGVYVYRIEVQNSGEEVEDYVIVTVTGKAGGGTSGAIPGFPIGLLVISCLLLILYTGRKMTKKTKLAKKS